MKVEVREWRLAGDEVVEGCSVDGEETINVK